MLIARCSARRVAHHGEAAVVGHLQPLVPVRRPAVGLVDPRRQRARSAGQRGPRARRRRPHAPRRRLARAERDQLGEGVERAADHVARLQARRSPDPRALRAPRRAHRAACGPRRRPSATCTRSAPKPRSRRLSRDRGMRLAPEHHMHLRRAEEPLRLHVPPGAAEELAARRRERGEVRHRRPGAEADPRAPPAARAGRASSPAATSSTAAAAGVGSAKPPFCPQAEVSQSAATPAGCEAPITQPWKFGLVIPRSPPSAFAASSSITAAGAQPRRRHRPGEARRAPRGSRAPRATGAPRRPRGGRPWHGAAAASKAAASAVAEHGLRPRRGCWSGRARSAAGEFSSFQAASARCGAGEGRPRHELAPPRLRLAVAARPPRPRRRGDSV